MKLSIEPELLSNESIQVINTSIHGVPIGVPERLHRRTGPRTLKKRQNLQRKTINTSRNNILSNKNVQKSVINQLFGTGKGRALKLGSCRPAPPHSRRRPGRLESWLVHPAGAARYGRAY
jgi:hypothetical protein